MKVGRIWQLIFQNIAANVGIEQSWRVLFGERRNRRFVIEGVGHHGALQSGALGCAC